MNQDVAKAYDQLAYDYEHHVDQTRYFNTDRKSTRLNSSHVSISYAVFCLNLLSHLYLHSFPTRRSSDLEQLFRTFSNYGLGDVQYLDMMKTVLNKDI